MKKGRIISGIGIAAGLGCTAIDKLLVRIPDAIIIPIIFICIFLIFYGLILRKKEKQA